MEGVETMTRSRKSAVLGGAATLAWGALVLVGCGGGEKAAPAGGEAAAPAASAPAAAGVAGPTGTATVSGKVTYDGAVPSLPAVSMSADPACAAKHTSEVPNPVLALGANKELGNVFVYVKSGLPENASWTPPSTPAVIDQNGCMYDPHVAGVMVGQQLEFKNSDGFLHNVHALPQTNQEFNLAMPGEVKTAEHTFDQAEGMFHVKCDVHPWMTAYVGVLKHPYFAVTGTDGSFTIKNLPAGKYTIAAWQEKMGEQTQEVTVADNGTATANFTFTRPAAGAGT
jgi:plastocyanin